jgi:hypothetical protein
VLPGFGRRHLLHVYNAQVPTTGSQRTGSGTPSRAVSSPRSAGRQRARSTSPRTDPMEPPAHGLPSNSVRQAIDRAGCRAPLSRRSPS